MIIKKHLPLVTVAVWQLVPRYMAYWTTQSKFDLDTSILSNKSSGWQLHMVLILIEKVIALERYSLNSINKCK